MRGSLQIGSNRERIAATNAANVQYAGRQRVLSGRREASKSLLLTVFKVTFKKLFFLIFSKLQKIFFNFVDTSLKTFLKFF